MSVTYVEPTGGGVKVVGQSATAGSRPRDPGTLGYVSSGSISNPYTQNITEKYRNPTTPARLRAQLPPPSPQAAGSVYWTTTGSKSAPQDRFMSVQDAYSAFPSLSQRAKDHFYGVMDKYYGKGRWDTSWVSGLWNKAVGAASYALTYEGRRVSPLDIFESVVSSETASGAGASGGGGGGGGAGGGGGPTTSISTTTSVNLTDPSTARGLVNQALTQYLGREANAKEQEAFLRALNAQERMNPTVTRQRSVSQSSGSTVSQTQDVMSQGGFNPSTFAQEYAQGQEGAAEFQAATGLLDSFMSALKARV